MSAQVADVGWAHLKNKNEATEMTFLLMSEIFNILQVNGIGVVLQRECNLLLPQIPFQFPWFLAFVSVLLERRTTLLLLVLFGFHLLFNTT